MSKRILFGGLLAVGLLTASAGTASAQFVTPYVQPGAFGNTYGAVYPTPSGGIVQKYGYTNPITGGTYLNSSYSNPFTGVVANRQAYVPYVNPYSYYYPSLYRPPVYYSNSYNYSVGGFNYVGVPYYNYGYRYGYRFYR